MVIPAIDRASGELQTLDEIIDWHRDIADALGEQRVAVQMAEGATEQELLDAYPRLNRADLQAALAYAADLIAHEKR